MRSLQRIVAAGTALVFGLVFGLAAVVAGAAPAQAVDLTSQIELSNLQSVGGPPTSANTPFSVSIDWRIPDTVAAHAGDTFTFDFGANISGYASSFEMKNSTGDVVANCVVQSSKFSCTLTSFVEGRVDIHGSMNLAMAVRNATTDNEILIIVQGNLTLATPGGISGGGSGGAPDYTDLNKGGVTDPRYDHLLQWNINFPGSVAVAPNGSDVVFQDTIDPRLTYSQPPDPAFVMSKYNFATDGWENLPPSAYTVSYSAGVLTFSVVNASSYSPGDQFLAVYFTKVPAGTPPNTQFPNTVRGLASSSSTQAMFITSGGTGDGTMFGSIGVYKVDASDTSKRLQGAVFEVRDAAGDLAGMIGPTDANGFATLGDLMPGDYTLHEITAPPGYSPGPDIPVTVQQGFQTPVIATNDEIVGTPGLAVVKVLTGNADEDRSGTVSVGDTLSYTVTGTNTGTTTLTNVVVSDNLTGQSTTCASVAAGATCVLNVTYVVTQADADAGSVVNTGTADSNETPPVTDVVTVPVPQNSDLSVVKALTNNADEDGSGTVSVGDTLSYTVTATNNGNTTLTNVVVSDNLTGQSQTCPTVAPGATCVLNVTYVVVQTDADAGSVVNTGTADSDQTPPVTNIVTTPVPQGPNLSVVKTLTGNADEDGSGSVSVGDTLSYRVTGTNTGNTTLTNVVVSDDLTGQSTTCATVLPGADCVLNVTYVVVQTDATAGSIVNTGTADSDQTPPVTDVVTVPVPTPGLSVVKVLTNNADEDGSGSVTVGDTLTYTVTGLNTGNTTLTNVVVSDDLTGQSTTCATVIPGATCVLTVTYVVVQTDGDAGAVVNTGTADSDQTPPVTDVVTIPIPLGPGLSVDKVMTNNADEDGSGTVTVGDTLSYTVTGTNIGNTTLTNVVVSDDLTGQSRTCPTLAPRSTCVLNVTYVVVQTDADAGSVVNTGTADSDQTQPVTDVIAVPLPQGPGLAVAKVLTGNADEDGSGTVSVGDTLTYTVTGSNIGNTTLTNVVVSDDLSGQSTTCASVAPGATCVLTVTYVVVQTDADAGSVVNTGTADSDQTPPVTDVVTVPVPVAGLTVVKTLTGNADEDGSGSVSVGDTLSYTVTGTNTGTMTLTNVVVSDDLTGQSTTCASVAPGGTCILNVTYVVVQTDADAGSVVNTGTADSDQTPPATDVVAIPVPQGPDLSVDKVLTNNADEDGSGTVTVGDTLSYTVTGTNTGNTTLTNVVVSDDLTGQSTTCATVLPGATCVLSVTYVVVQTDADAGSVVNAGTADSNETPPVTDIVTTPVPQGPNLSLVKVLTNNADEDGSGTVTVGDTLTYTVTGTNAGNMTLTNVVISDDLTGQSTTCATVLPGTTCVLTVTYAVVQADADAGSVVNTATGDSDQTPQVTDVVTVPIPQGPDLAVAKVLTGNADEDGSGTVTVGDTLSYTVTGTNTGNTTLTNVVVSDDLTGQSTTCATVAPGATCVLSVTYVVVQGDADAGSVVNTGTADSDQTPPVTDVVTVPVPQNPELSVVKVLTNNADEDGSGSVTVGDTLSYTVTGTNTGNTTLTNVVVSDDLTGQSTTCASLAPGAACVLAVTYVVVQSDTDAGSVVNTGTGDSDQTPPVTDVITVPIPQTPDLSVVKTLTGNADEDGSGSVTVGDTLSYTVTATNTGNTTLTNVVVSDDLTGQSTTCATLPLAATCVLSVSYVVAQKDADAGSVVNTGTADSDQTPPVTDVVTEPVPQGPGLSVVKTLTGNADEDGSGTASVGDTLSYTVVGTNTGNITLTDVVVSDDLTGQSVTCATLAPGATCVLAVSYVVAQSDAEAGSVVNTGTADSNQTPPVTDVVTDPVPPVPPAPTPPSMAATVDDLAQTGMNILVPLVLAVGLVAAGAVVSVLRRRRRPSHRSENS